MECQSNAHQIVVAAIRYAVVNNGKLPALDDGRLGWPIHLMPHLDQAALFRHLDADPRALDKVESRPILKIFTCPNDSQKLGKPGALSYVANAGWGRFAVGKDESISEVREHSLDIDWDSDDNVSDDELNWTRSTGVFWRPPSQRSVITLDEIAEADGQSQTIMFAENINAQTWLSRKTIEIGFVVDLGAIHFQDPSDPMKRLLTKSGSLGPFAIQAKPRVVPGHSPVPSSYHAGFVTVAFADGRASQMNVNIDPQVFLSLMTHNGQRFGEPANLGAE